MSLVECITIITVTISLNDFLHMLVAIYYIVMSLHFLIVRYHIRSLKSMLQIPTIHSINTQMPYTSKLTLLAKSHACIKG